MTKFISARTFGGDHKILQTEQPWKREGYIVTRVCNCLDARTKRTLPLGREPFNLLVVGGCHTSDKPRKLQRTCLDCAVVADHIHSHRTFALLRNMGCSMGCQSHLSTANPRGGSKKDRLPRKRINIGCFHLNNELLSMHFQTR